MRSRLEAETAFLLTVMRLEWQYEPRSVLLPSGIHYLPDFYVPAPLTWVEARGYSTHESEEQIAGFADLVEQAGVATDFVVIGPGTCTLHECNRVGDTSSSNAFVARCRACSQVSFCGWSGAWFCRWCGTADGNSWMSDLWDLDLQDGHLRLIDSLGGPIALPDFGRILSAPIPGKQKLARAGAVLAALQRGPAIGAAIRRGSALLNAAPRPEGTEAS